VSQREPEHMLRLQLMLSAPERALNTAQSSFV
jgi:hypothetical protein